MEGRAAVRVHQVRHGLGRGPQGGLFIDLYQIHWSVDDIDEHLEGWATLAALQKEGKLRWIGVSNFSREELERAQSIAPITSLQPPYSLIKRDVEGEILPW